MFEHDFSNIFFVLTLDYPTSGFLSLFKFYISSFIYLFLFIPKKYVSKLSHYVFKIKSMFLIYIVL